MAQDDDVSDLKQRLGLDKSDDDESSADEGEAASSGGDPRGGGQQQGGGAQSGGGKSGQGTGGVHEAETRVAPPPGQRGDQQQQQQGRQGQQQQQQQQRGQGGGGAPDASSAAGDRGGGARSGGAPGGRSQSGGPGGGPPGGGGPPQGGPPGGGPSQGGGGEPPAGFDDTAPTSDGFGDESGGEEAAAPDEDLLDDLDEDLDPGEGLLNQGIFTTQILVVVAIVAVLGLVIGSVGSSTLQQRSLYNSRTAQGKKVYSKYKKRFENLQTLKERLNNINPSEQTFEETQKTAEELSNLQVNLKLQGISTAELMRGAKATQLLVGYIGTATQLKKQLDEHARLTTSRHKEKLKKAMTAGSDGSDSKDEEEGEGNDGGSDAAPGDAKFAVWFPVQKYQASIKGFLKEAKDAESDEDVPEYKPGFAGRIVTLDKLKPNTDGKVEVRYRGSGSTDKKSFRGLVPIRRGQLLSGDGLNSYTLYRERLQDLRKLVATLEKTAKPLKAELEKLANRGGAPLIQL